MSQPQFEFGEENESTTGWTWPVVVFLDGRLHRRSVSLGFQDYDLWSRGRVPPVHTAEACVRWLLEHEAPDALPDPFDCGRVRRTHPGIDAELPARLGIRFGG